MTRKKFALIIVFWFVAVIVGFSAIAFYYSQFRFIKTAGFYFTGLNSAEIGDIHAYGFNRQFDTTGKIHVLLHYKQNDDYIYDKWRWDFENYGLVDSIQLVIPEALLPEIGKIYFKYDKSVVCLSKDDFVATWPHNTHNKLIYFTIPGNLLPDNNFMDGVKCLMYGQDMSIKIVRYVLIICVVTGLVLLVISYFQKLKKVGKYLYNGLFVFVRKHKAFSRKITAFVLGLCMVLILLEITLRVVGYMHNKKNIETQYKKKVDNKNLILCVGDSFTESFGATEGNDYPAQLERIINKHALQKYTVLNFGRSGKNTSQIAMEVPLYIRNYRPSLVVLLAGSANYWNYWGYNENKRGGGLKIVTFFKLLKKNIVSRKHKSMYDPGEYVTRRDNCLHSLPEKCNYDSPVLKAIRSHNYAVINRYIDSCRNAGAMTENDVFHLLVYSALFRKGEPFDSIKNIKAVSERTEFLSLLDDRKTTNSASKIKKMAPAYQGLYYFFCDYRYASADKENLQKSILLNPYLEDAYFNLYNIGCQDIILPVDYQQKRFSLIDSVNYYKYLYGISVQKPGVLKAYIDENLEGELERSKIDQWVFDDLSRIIDTCRHKGIKVVLMDYPLLEHNNLFGSVNEVLRAVAEKYRIPFVKNSEVFDKITFDRNSYFISDGHCSDKGYNLISSNIYKVLLDNRLLVTKNSEPNP